MISFFLWFFGFIPELIVHITLLLGLCGIILSYFMQEYDPRKQILKIVSVILFVIGVYFEGGLSVKKDYQKKEREWVSKIKTAENKSQEVITEVREIYVDKIKVVKDVQVVVQEKIRDVSVNIDSKCQITTETTDILNQAAKNEVTK
jgi:hypothetical protein